MTRKEFIEKLKDIGFSQMKFEYMTNINYLYIYLQHTILDVYITKENIRIYIRRKTELDYTKNVLLKETKKVDEKILKSIKKIVRLFA